MFGGRGRRQGEGPFSLSSLMNWHQMVSLLILAYHLASVWSFDLGEFYFISPYDEEQGRFFLLLLFLFFR